MAQALEPEKSEQPVPADLAAAIEYSRALVGALPEATVLVVGADERIWLAEGRIRVARTSGQELVGRALHEILPPATRPMLTERYRAALDGSSDSFEYLTSYGTTCRIQLSPLRLGHPQPVAVAAVVLDLTERQRITAELRAAERARTESELLFRQGFDASPIGMALVTPDEKRFLSVNDALCRLLRRSRSELVGMYCAEVTHPDDADADEQARLAMLGAHRAQYECEKRYVRPDGSVVWGSLHVTPVYSAEGEIRAFFAQIVDLTARKERELALLQEASDAERLAAVRSALAEERLILHAQPIVDVASGRVVQHELLVRMRDEHGQIVAPGEFLPVAERHGLIARIDRWVVRQAVALAATGRPVEVNLSAASVGDAETLRTIRQALHESGADPALLVFEVTETALMADLERGRAFAAALHELGCRFALDDFGTGYGTFTYLKHLPIDYLKIDIEFVRDLVRDEADERLVRVIVSVARELGKRTIAEGVENAATLERLRALGVDHAQGFHFGRPAPLDETHPHPDLAAA